MSQTPDQPDPYLAPRPQPGDPRPGDQSWGSQTSGSQTPGYQAQGYQAPGDATSPYPSGQWSTGQPAPGYPPPAPGAGAEEVRRLRAARPPSVRRLLAVMVAGAVLTVLTGVYALTQVGAALDEEFAGGSAELDQIARDSGLDSGTLLELGSQAAVVGIVVVTLLEAALWLLFAWLFSRGQGRVPGTVLAAINGLLVLVGLLGVASALELVSSMLTVALIGLGLVLLWRPETSAWFGALRQARVQAQWG